MKKVILILHGWGSSPQKWEKVKSALAKKKFKVYVPYLPGFDPKKNISKPWTIEDYSSWLNQFFKENKIKKAIIIGHSNGGRIATYFTSINQKKIDKLILIGCAGLPQKNQLKKIFFKTLSKIGKKILQLIPNKKIYQLGQKVIYRLSGENDYFKSSTIMKKTMINMISVDLTKNFLKIKKPTLIIWGKNDKETPIWMAKKINLLIKNSKLKIINDGEHNLHLSHPNKLVQIIKEELTINNSS